MGNLRACFVVATLALAACGDDGGSAKQDAAVVMIDAAIDAKQFFDAPPPSFDFSCMGNSAPTTAAAQVTLGGTVQQVDFSGGLSISALDGATVTACPAAAANCNNDDGTDTTSGGGNYSIGPITTGGMPLDEYLEMTNTGSRTAYVYPASPFTADQPNIPILTFTALAQTALNAGFGCDTSLAIVGLAVTDCADMPITDSSNLEITIKQGGTVVAGTTVIDVGTLEPAAAGTFLVCGVPANASTEVGATYNGMALRAHNVRTVAGATTATLLRPGF